MSLAHVPEIKALVQSGDIDLESERGRFFGFAGRKTELSDDELIEALAMEEDGPDDLVFAEAVTNIEARKQASNS